ncbi:MAG TPA: transporter [Cytophagales bacterium]|nr:transporter [Cytophagales bacterium]
MKKVVYLLVIAGLTVNYPLFSQDTLRISQSELLENVASNNYQIKIADQQVSMARADYRQSNALYLPSLSVSHTAMSTTNPLMAFGAKLNQEILTPADFDPAQLNDPSRTQNYATEVLVLQPLFNLDGVYERQAAKIQQDAIQLQADRTREAMELEVGKAYMQLQLAYEAAEVLERARVTSQEGVKLITDYYEEGLIQKSDLLAVQVRATEVENQLRYAKTNIRNASEYIGFLMGKGAEGTIYKPTERAPISIEQVDYPQLLSSFRKDIVAMEKSVTGYEKMLRSSRMKFLPTINAFGSYQLYDEQLLGMSASGYLVGAKLSWNLFDGYKSVGKMSKAKAETDKARMENEQYKLQQQMELNKTNRQLADAERKVQLTRLALDQSAEAYRIRKDRFEEGLEKTTDLLMAETQMFQKELEFRQAIFEYNFTKEYLEFLTR